MLAREDGQILPGLAVLLVVTLGLGILFFQVGKASVFRSDAQNAADAAALAGAKEIQRQLQLQWATAGTTSAGALDPAAVVARMQEYAGRNDGVLVKQELNLQAVDVKAWTISKDELGPDAEPAARQDFQATAKARAQVGFGVPAEWAGQGTESAPGTVPPGGTPKLSDADWEQLEHQMGPKPRDCADIITLGLAFVHAGFMVWQNDDPRLGGDAGHTDRLTSAHHDCNDRGALDVNFGGGGNLIPAETRAIDPLIGPLSDLGFHTIWRDGGEHDNHLHVDVRGEGWVGGAGGGGGFAGPLEDAVLDIKLVDWEKPVEALVDIGGPWPTTSDLSGPPDPKIMALMCQLAGRYGPRVLLATFETAIVESGIHNLNWGDAHSHGVFQQQWDAGGYGTPADTMNPPKATRMFLDRLLPVASRYPYLSSGQIAALVQRPRADLVGRYDQVKGQAQALIASHC